MKLGIIGYGNIGSAIIDGILEKKVLKKKDILIFDIDKNKTKNLKLKIEKNNCDLVKNSNIIILAVKPKDAKNVIDEIKNSLSNKKLLISVMAGISIKKLEEFLDKKIPIIRVMPNINVKVKAGIIIYCSNKEGKKYEKIFKRIFSPIGIIMKMPENKFDTITAISGSGPGFLFYIAELMEKIGIEKGIPAKNSRELISYLFYGTGKMLFETKMKPEDLKRMVCSPGGTTLAGLNVFEEEKFPDILKKVINMAEKRSKELSQS
ncbi:MAG: pyrroline-5-carboxylate reductase [Candidatus Omnitrophica bacterium]|nr:pyrroline-5-carboxylate reductase [Candidatus Omnitrophota bacterium]MCM8807079.1 pyrroline-5-carboxylate reductase [Candidatus Omnitrophota bacterium]